MPQANPGNFANSSRRLYNLLSPIRVKVYDQSGCEPEFIEQATATLNDCSSLLDSLCKSWHLLQRQKPKVKRLRQTEG